MTRLRRHQLKHPVDDEVFRTPTGQLWSSDRINHAIIKLVGKGE